MKTKIERGTTANALLGLLTIHPMSGYDMRALIDRSIGHFWSESYGQIYPALKWLETEGLVQKKTEQKEGRPDRNVFSLTPNGKKRLKEWLSLPPAEAEVPRSELLLKIFFGQHVPADVSRQHLQSFKEVHEEAIKQYLGVEKQLKKEETHDPQLPYWLMTLSFGRHRSGALVAWAKESLRKLDELESERSGETAEKKRASGKTT